jgi:hypothetical protein
MIVGAVFEQMNYQFAIGALFTCASTSLFINRVALNYVALHACFFPEFDYAGEQVGSIQLLHTREAPYWCGKEADGTNLMQIGAISAVYNMCMRVRNVLDGNCVTKTFIRCYPHLIEELP